MDTTIRLAIPQDAAALCHLNDLFNGPGTVLADVQKYLESNHREIIAVALLDTKLVGFACAQVTATFYEPEALGEITELYVLPVYRRTGVATQLITYLENHLKHACGVGFFKLLTGKDNLEAQKFYEKMGYQREDEIFYTK